MKIDSQALLNQIDAALKVLARIEQTMEYDDFSGVEPSETSEFVTLALATIDRIAGPTSAYASQARRRPSYDHALIPQVGGVLKALRADVAAGHLSQLRELLHAELFSDYLEMGDHLLEAGYKDAAAVICGSTLEAHLRQLAAKYSIPLHTVAASGATPKKADTLNADLVKATAYGKLEQKSVTAWLDLRNNAAHGHYALYTAEHVSVMLMGVRHFMTQHPA